MSTALRTEPVQERSKKRLQEIVDCARALTLEHGRGWNVEEIPKALGCSVGILYRYFETRDDILEYLFPSWVETLEQVRALTPRSVVVREATAFQLDEFEGDVRLWFMAGSSMDYTDEDLVGLGGPLRVVHHAGSGL